MSKTKNKMMAFIITASFPMMLFFQNCGQQGTLQVTGTDLASNASVAGDDIPKDPIVDDTQTDTGGGSGGGGMVIVPPTMPPVVDQPVTSTPSYPQDPNVPAQPPVVVQPPAGGSSGQAPQDPHVPATDCRHIQIADIRLSIAGVGGEEKTCGGGRNSSRGNHSADFELVDANASVSLNNQKIRIRALKNVELKTIFIRLNDSGNQVLGMNNVVMDLVTPSAQESGLKLKLDKSVKLRIDQIYELQLEIRAEDQIVGNANKCIFKPVIKSVKIVSEKDSQSSGHQCDKNEDPNVDDDSHGQHRH